MLAAADRNPGLYPRPNLKPGHRFFILNGEDLFNFPVQDNRELNLKYAQSQAEQIQLPVFQQPESAERQSEIDVNNIPVQNILLRSAASAPDFNTEDKFGNFVALNQQTADQALFRSSFPINIESESIHPIGQFRYTPPSEPYYALDAEDFANDAIVVEAKLDGSEATSDASSKPEGRY